MSITAQMVKELRERTGAGMMDAKKMLTEANGDIDKAIELLRKKGQKVADKKADRTTSEGRVGMYVHSNGTVAGMVTVECETDFVARNEQFIAVANDLAMQVVAMNPTYLTPDQVPTEVKDKEREIYQAEMEAEGKPADVIEKILDGKLEKFYSQVCLLKQPFIKDDSMSVEKWLTEQIAKLGENINIREFVRYQV